MPISRLLRPRIWPGSLSPAWRFSLFSSCLRPSLLELGAWFGWAVLGLIVRLEQSLFENETMGVDCMACFVLCTSRIRSNARAALLNWWLCFAALVPIAILSWVLCWHGASVRCKSQRSRSKGTWNWLNDIGDSSAVWCSEAVNWNDSEKVMNFSIWPSSKSSSNESVGK